MGHRWKRWRASPAAGFEIDLLSTAFGLPSRRDIKRADRKATIQTVYQYENTSDDTLDSLLIQESDNSSDDADTENIRRIPATNVSQQQAVVLQSSPSRKRQHPQGRVPSSTSQHRPLVKKARDVPLENKVKRPKPKRTGGSARKAKTMASKSTSPTRSIPSVTEPPNSPMNCSPQVVPNVNTFHSLGPFGQQFCSGATSQPRFAPRQTHIPLHMPQYARAYVFQPSTKPPLREAIANARDTRSKPQASQFQKLRSFQEQLDCARERLSNKPDDAQLQQDEQNAQGQLNNILNFIVTEKTRGRQESLSTSDTRLDSKGQHPVKDEGQENAAHDKDAIISKSQISSGSQKREDQTLRFNHQKSRSPSCTIRHHLCSGCGHVDGVINDASVVEMATQESFSKIEQNPRSCASTAFSPNATNGSKDSSCSYLSHLPNTRNNRNPNRGKHTNTLRLEDGLSGKSTSVPVSPAISSSVFLPGRRSGSTQRRAQRASTPHLNENHLGSSGDLAENKQYHVPYVEDVDSIMEEVEMPGSHCNDIEALQSKDDTNHSMNTKIDKKDGSSIARGESCFVSYQTPHSRDRSIPEMYSTNSSGQRTVKYDHRRKNASRHQHTESVPNETSSQESQARFSNGVFGKTGVFEQSKVDHLSNDAFRHSSPLVEFERSSFSGSFDKTLPQIGPHTVETEQSKYSAFRSSRGAFERKQTGFNMFDYSDMNANRSKSRSPDVSDDGSISNDRRTEYSFKYGSNPYPYSSQDNTGRSSFSSSSSSRDGNEAFSQRPTEAPHSRSVFTNYSCSSDNPYYKPRRRCFPVSSDGEFRSSWNWNNSQQQVNTSRGFTKTKFDNGVPHPIIEEPTSPPPSPIRKPMLLGKLIISHPVAHNL
ncbi:hypothetical protein QQS21_010531 [Conoideocrella luteorostrata]|uniref:Uncharacterized protein n=1 Tax=Conoideocrella luteorostrata TaxID=1105319 RepID=A0AAJ0CHI5_9HYPO|nr:hypothetical protein QQS21_010531 [Conoideocrella luteorostrata]